MNKRVIKFSLNQERGCQMLKSGDGVEIVDNQTEHSFNIGDIVYFLGVNLDEPYTVFVFTNGEIEQGLYYSDFQLLT